MPLVVPPLVFGDVAAVAAIPVAAVPSVFGAAAPVVAMYLAEAPTAFDAPVLVFAPAPAATAFDDDALAPATVFVVISWNVLVLVPAELANSLVLCLMLKIDDMLIDVWVLW